MTETPERRSPGSRQPGQAAHGKLEIRLAGVVAAALTPCSEPGIVDGRATKNLCRKAVGLGCQGVLVAGSTGEAPLLDEEDRRTVVRAAREGVIPPAVLYVGVGGGGLRQTLRYATNAANDGADVALATAPLLLKWNQAELEAYVTAVADACPIPVGIYHHKRMASSFGVETLARLAGHPNIVVIKDTSLDEQRMCDLLAVTKGTNTAIFQGTEPLILSSLQAGAHGCISALAGVVPELVHHVFDAFAGNDFESAREYQSQLSKLATIFRLKEAGESFSYFVHALKLIAVRRGWIESTHSLSSGFTPNKEFKKAVLEIIDGVGIL